MKLRIKPATNTEKTLLEVLKKRGVMTPEQLVDVVYPQSQQPMKKAATFHGHLLSMERRGDVVMVSVGTAWRKSKWMAR